MARAPFEIGDISVAPGERRNVSLPLSVMSNRTPITLPIHVAHGKREGPTMFVSAAIHGDEVVGVEIVRRLLSGKVLNDIAGTALMVPIVNAFGFIGHSRYLPDRRDLNRSFPGNGNGSLAAQLAHLFMSQVVERSDIGIDLHTAAINRSNLPQIRVDTTDERALQIAMAFAPPLLKHASLRPGSLRDAAATRGVPVIVYECGEALRFDEVSIRVGVQGVIRAMTSQGMLRRRKTTGTPSEILISDQSQWLRLPDHWPPRRRRRPDRCDFRPVRRNPSRSPLAGRGPDHRPHQRARGQPGRCPVPHRHDPQPGGRAPGRQAGHPP